jgi:hypothetical protein
MIPNRRSAQQKVADFSDEIMRNQNCLIGLADPFDPAAVVIAMGQAACLAAGP